jgi:hypothetical protein
VSDILGRLADSLADRYRLERELGQGGMDPLRGQPRFDALVARMRL